MSKVGVSKGNLVSPKGNLPYHFNRLELNYLHHLIRWELSPPSHWIGATSTISVDESYLHHLSGWELSPSSLIDESLLHHLDR
ncbi:hypothetical protein L1987_53319 [Smallanthus sonchifolius]|uniref:Uncharacterized protein n=1 Tax=Smallanthus sonchifolius TaxID=185202 RepID=A0ACB9EVL2_9ASTR|nr:hypothetical protein L1987_53319 [Smallanthus sonchifolius]